MNYSQKISCYRSVHATYLDTECDKVVKCYNDARPAAPKQRGCIDMSHNRDARPVECRKGRPTLSLITKKLKSAGKGEACPVIQGATLVRRSVVIFMV